MIDETEESRLALRYAARRAAHVGGAVKLLRIMPAPDFVEWGAVQRALEAEAIEAAESLLKNAADEIELLTGRRPDCAWRRGDPAATQVRHALDEDEGVRALVLAAAGKGAPGPLVSFFTGERAGALPCLVIVVPGALTHAQVDALA